MIVPDINLILYAEVATFPHHVRARAWWVASLEGRREIGLAAPVVFGFLRLVTNPRVFVAPMSLTDALARVEEWLDRPHVRVLVHGPRHIVTAFDLLRGAGVARDLTTDAQIAALAIEHGGEVHSNDVDFARFAGVRCFNPLA